MSEKKTRIIPGSTFGSKERGGGSETVEWVRNGPFLMRRSYSVLTPGTPMFPGYGAVFLGMPTLIGPGEDSDSSVRANGTKAMNIAYPLSPSVSLLTSAGELAKDGVPSPMEFLRWKATVRDILRDTAGRHVALQFAWLPLLADIKNWARQVERSDAIINEVKSLKSNDTIRTGYSFPVDSQSINFSNSNHVGLDWVSGSLTGARANSFSSQYYEKRTWFEATYVNFNPIADGQYSASQEFGLKAKYLLGIDLTPEILWELAPWSWAVDWFTNFGDVLSSVSNVISDGLVLRDAFVMHHIRRESETVGGPWRASFAGTKTAFAPSRSYTISEVKKRFHAIPYLGFDPVGTLTNRQLSILAALAINKLA